MSFQITLRAARVNAGLSTKDAAEALHVSNKTLLNWENGKSSPTIEKFRLICALYAVPIDAILLSSGSL